jgi:hypothetical protein
MQMIYVPSVGEIVDIDPKKYGAIGRNFRAKITWVDAVAGTVGIKNLDVYPFNETMTLFAAIVATQDSRKQAAFVKFREEIEAGTDPWTVTTLEEYGIPEPKSASMKLLVPLIIFIVGCIIVSIIIVLTRSTPALFIPPLQHTGCSRNSLLNLTFIACA